MSAPLLADQVRGACRRIDGAVHLLRCLQERAEQFGPDELVSPGWYAPSIDVIARVVTDVTEWLESRAEIADTGRNA